MRYFKCNVGFIWALLIAAALGIISQYWEFSIEPAPPAVPAPPSMPVPRIEVVEDTIQKNKTLVATLVDYEVPVAIANEVADLIKPVFDVRKLRFGNPFRLEKDSDGSLRAFEYKIDDEKVLRVARAADSYHAKVETLEFETRETILTAEIENSLWHALIQHPKGDYLVDQLVQIFQWDVDFNTEIQPGDEVRFIIDGQYHEGKFVKYGKVHAAELVNAGKSYHAFLFNGSYYDDKGNALKREFLASPLKFTRISSGYSRRRMHPILGTARAHLAVDYAAPTGTPVQAIANGTVAFAGWSGGYGRLVQIRHPNGLVTGYAHLSRIASGVRAGAKIDQGELIGNVGMTGLANGPHLHFMMTERGRPINPDLRLRKGGPRIPLQAAQKEEFLRYIAPKVAQLDTKVAAAN
ncbi:MAG: peptidoglycan DD-metalloendopeptidase family protein [Acidobacteria bacterium]|nr:peptidoglycan DD-metalloendopeptidase family protein [Acidobacteriota bacterium]